MGIGSFPELFLQYFAWGIYNIAWDVLVNLGIVYIPFGYYLFDAFSKGREKGTGKVVAKKVVYKLQVQLVLGVIVLTMAGVPTITLNFNHLKFNERVCKVGSATPTFKLSKAGKGTGTTYDPVFTASSMGSMVAKAPVAWMGVLAISQAISDGIRSKIPCKTSLSQIAYELKIDNIKTPATQQEVADFYRSCFQPAKNKFSRELPKSYTPAMQEKKDNGWLGSEFYLKEKGYYDTFRSSDPISGFPFDDKGRDKGLWNGKTAKPKWGRPYCKEWYEDKKHGIRTKIINEYDKSTWTKLKNGLTVWTKKSKVNAEDELIRTIVDVSQVKTIPQRNYGQVLGGFGYDMGGTSEGLTSNGIANAGTFLFNPVFYPTFLIMKKALPLVHAMLIMGLILFIPLLLILSQYGIKEVLAMSALLFSVKLWPLIWTIGAWMQASLEEVLLPNLTQGFLNTADQVASINDDVIDYTIAAWYFMGPLLLSTVVSVAGYQSGNAIEAATKGNKSGDKAGQDGGKQATDTAKSGASKYK